VTRLPTADVELVVAYDGRVASAPPRNRPVKLWLRPVRGLEIEDDDVGKMLAVLVLATEDEQLGALP